MIIFDIDTFMKKIIIYLLFSITLHASSSKDAEFQAWCQNFKTEAITQGISQKTLDYAFDGLVENDKVLSLDKNQSTENSAFEYMKKFFTLNKRIEQGKVKIAQHQGILNEISRKYQIPIQYIVALWGVETRYGEESSNYPVIQSLATLAWKSRRADMFKGELILALKMIDQGYTTLENFKGSWAGATGQCQFMPSSFFTFSVPIGKTNIWTSSQDVFESIANYLKKSGWNQNQPWGHLITHPEGVQIPEKATNAQFQTLGVRKIGGGNLDFPDTQTFIIKPLKMLDFTYLLYPNFKIILKWNNSRKFALGVGLLADGLAR